MRRATLSTLLPLLSLVVACSAHPATQVLVLFHAEAGLRADAVSIHVTVEGPDGTTAFDATNPVSGSAASSLARVPLVPENGDASRTFAIEADLLDAGGATLATVLAVSGYAQDQLLELHLWFDDACRGVASCGSGRTCDRGLCVGACFDGAPVGATDCSAPTCGECAECLGHVCTPSANGMPCGCTDTDTCNAGACTTSTPVAYAAGGHLHSCAALRNDELYCFGSNRVGQLGSMGGETNTPRIVALGALSEGTAGTDHTCWLQFTGERHCWGWGGNAQLGDGTTDESGHDAPVAAPSGDPAFFSLDAGWFFTCGLSNDKRVHCWGGNDHGQCGMDPTTEFVLVPTLVNDDADWKSVTAGGFHACAIKDDGRLYCWGLNASGELGTGDNEDRATPVQTGCPDGRCIDDWASVAAGDFHTCAIRESGEMWCWGGGLNGQLGVGATMERDSNRPLRVTAAPERFRAVAGGSSHTCAIAEDETLWCWGRNDHGQLGTGDLERRSVPTRITTPGGDGWIGLGLGRDHTCAVRADETLWCWGWNENGQLGLGFTTPGGDPPETTPGRVCFPSP